MKTVYVPGLSRCGLGNHLFQIAVAINYAEKYDYKIVLISNDTMLYGTSNMFNKKKCHYKDNKILGYNHTILSKFNFISPAEFSAIKNNQSLTIIHNHLKATDKTIPISNQDLEISGFSQDVSLFKDVLGRFSTYFNYHDPDIINYINNKYGNLAEAVCLCIRKGDDFKHMTKLSTHSYQKALEQLKKLGINTRKLFIIADIPDIHNYFDLDNYCNVEESDIVQMYFGIMCKHYILSESTFSSLDRLSRFSGRPYRQSDLF